MCIKNIFLFSNNLLLPRICAIYCIKNIENNKVYIGSSLDIRKRFINHKLDLKKNNHTNTYLQNSYNKYGEKSFTISILEKCDKINIIEKEQYWMDYFKSYSSKIGYNILKKARSSLNYKHTEETKIKLSSSIKKFHKANPGVWKGRKLSEEVKQNIRKTRKKVYNKKSVSNITREKLRIALTGKKLSNKHKESISKSHLNSTKEYCWKFINQYDLVGNFIRSYNSLTEAVKINNYNGYGNISNCCNGKLNSAYGYKWKYE